MSQHDFNIANQTAPAFRADLNSAITALASNSSGATEPTGIGRVANMTWYDTATNILKIRSEADDAWISIGYLDQASNTFISYSQPVATVSSENSTSFLGSFSTDLDGRMLRWDGTSYKYPKGMLLKSYHIDNETTYTFTGPATHIRQSVPFTPVSSSSNIFITCDVNTYQNPGDGVTGNEPIMYFDLYVGASKVADRRVEMDGIAGGASIKGSQSMGTKVRVASYTGSRDVEIRTVYTTGDLDISIVNSGLCIEEFSD